MNMFGNIVVSALSGATAAGAVVFAGSVALQDASPGTTETGHSHISGYALAGRFGANVSPTLARVQVNETGTLQGVRSITTTGVAVYGQSNATTGLGAGGYFTSASAGGRAVVAEQFSATGNTVGGLFKSNSTAGTGLWGRAPASGPTTGIYGEVASATGIAIRAQNTGTGRTVDLAGPNGAVYVGTGMLTKKYDVNPVGAIPIAYGAVNNNGTVGGGSGNFTVSRSAAGIYQVTVTGENYFYNTHPTVLTGSINTRCNVVHGSSAGKLYVEAYDHAGVLTDDFFTFVMYKTVPDAMYPRVPNHGFKHDMEWAVKRPREFAAHTAKCRDAERAALSGSVSPRP